ncbi:MAG: hypothetical protein JOZ69_07790 [Myxococcales bacterium]|nr:hypothetical protein [Myxococcales bacterium]
MTLPDPRELLESNPKIIRYLNGYAFKKTRDHELAYELAHDAVLRVLEGKGWHRWDPARKELLNHLSDVVKALLADRRKRAFLRREQPMVDGDEDRAPDSKPSPDRQMEGAQELARRRRLAAQVMARVAEDPIIPRMLEHKKAGIQKPAELARLLGCAVKDIYRAHDRLTHHRERVLEEERRREAALEAQRIQRKATSP